MAIIKYEFGDIRFILFPVEYGGSQLVIKEFEKHDDYDLGQEMVDGNVLCMVATKDNDNLTRNRISYSYSLLKETIVRVATQYNFPLPDVFLADEYLTSFIDTFSEYLGFPKHNIEYSLTEIKLKLYNVIPILIATTHSFGENVTEIGYNIDSYDRYRSGLSHMKQLNEALIKVKEGFRPKVTVKIVSERYNMELINYYIGFLESQRCTFITRPFKSGQRDEKIYNVPLWKTWNKEVLSSNIQTFFSHFYMLYDNYVGVHFPYIQHHLQIIQSEDITIVHVLLFDDNRSCEPWIEIYYLRPEKQEKGQVLTFLAEDFNNPIDRQKYFEEDITECRVGVRSYQIVAMRVQTLNFMFSDSPSYSLIKERLKDRLERFFSEKRSTEA